MPTWLDTPTRLLLAGVACGVVPMLGAPFSPAALPLSIGWGSMVGAALLALHAAIQRSSATKITLPQSAAPYLAQLVAGVAVAAACGLSLLLEPRAAATSTSNGGAPTDERLTFVIAGLVASAHAGWFWWRHRRGTPMRLLHVALALVICVAVVEAARERGVASLAWARVSLRRQVRWSGTQQCSGINLGAGGVRRARRIAAYKPGLALAARHLGGDVGRLLAAAIPRPSPPSSNVATAHIGGRFDAGSWTCFTPLHRWTTLRAQLRLNLVYRTGGRAKDGARWALRCNGLYSAEITLSAQMTGIAACRDLRAHLARELLAIARAKAAKLTGQR